MNEIEELLKHADLEMEIDINGQVIEGHFTKNYPDHFASELIVSPRKDGETPISAYCTTDGTRVIFYPSDVIDYWVSNITYSVYLKE